MEKLFKLFLLIICLGLFNQNLHAQKNVQNTVTGIFKDLPIREFIEVLKQQTNFIFYYDPSLYDSIRFTLTVDREPITAVLDRAFENTSFKYSIDSHNQIFLTKGVVIQTNLADFSFDSAKMKSRAFYTEINDSKNDNASLQNAKLENKIYQIGIYSVNNGQSNALVSGYIRDAKTGEAVSGASIYIDKPHIGISTDQYGYYTLSLTQGPSDIKYSEYRHERYQAPDCFSRRRKIEY